MSSDYAPMWCLVGLCAAPVLMCMKNKSAVKSHVNVPIAADLRRLSQFSGQPHGGCQEVVISADQAFFSQP